MIVKILAFALMMVDVGILLLLALFVLVIKKYLIAAISLAPMWLLYQFHHEIDGDDPKVKAIAITLLRPTIYVFGAAVGIFALSIVAAWLWDVPLGRFYGFST